jgi:hypothetical protein
MVAVLAARGESSMVRQLCFQNFKSTAVIANVAFALAASRLVST